MYSPKIDESLVKELYLHKTKSENKRPMTYYVNLAIMEYLERSVEDESKQTAPDYRVRKSNLTTIKSGTGG